MREQVAEMMRLKVIVIGAENSGKTTLVKKLSPTAKSVEHFDEDGNSITVGLDIGKIELAGCSLYFFGTPGHQRFEFARKIVSHGAHMGILMIDSVESTDKGIGKREIDFEQELIKSQIPYVICANKRDASGVLPLEEIQQHFKADVYPIAAKSGQGVVQLRDVLVKVIESHKEAWYSAPRKRVAYA